MGKFPSHHPFGEDTFHVVPRVKAPEGYPARDTVITADEIINLKISLNHECWTVEQFLAAM